MPVTLVADGNGIDFTNNDTFVVTFGDVVPLCVLLDRLIKLRCIIRFKCKDVNVIGRCVDHLNGKLIPGVHERGPL